MANPISTVRGGVGGPPAGPEREASVRRPRVSGRSRWFWLVGAVIPVLLLGLWWSASHLGWVAPHKLPTPEAVVTAAVDLWERGRLGLYIAISLQRVLIGFAIGALIGLVLGAIVGLSRLADGILAPTIGAARAVPSLAWVPLLILYLGFGEDSKVTLVAIGALFPVYTTVAGALRHVDPQLVEMGRAFGLDRMRLLLAVQLPAVIPAIVSGLRLALAQAWLFLVAAELLGSTMGLGFLLIESQNNLRTDRLFLAIVVLAVLGKLSDALIGILERVLLKRWG